MTLIAVALIPLTALILSANPAHAQTIYRCGADGRSYADTPCRDGRAVEVNATRPATDLAEAREAARREQALAERLRQERLERQAQAPVAAAGIRGARGAVETKPVNPRWKTKSATPQRSHRLQQQQPLEDDGIYREAAPGSRRTKG